MSKLRRWTGSGMGRFACVVAVAADVLVGGARTVRADGPPGHGWLGVAMASVNDPGGVRVERVIHGSPAEKAGVRSEDRIAQVDGKDVGTPRDVARLVGVHGAGDSVRVTVVRAAQPQPVRLVVPVLLAEFPSSDAMLRMDHVGEPAPAWDGLESTSGFPGSLASLRGRVVLVDFWATWCGPCREMAPVLSGWQARYGAEGLSVVGITTDPAEAAAHFKEQLSLRYPMASDPHATTSSLYGVTALPTLFVVDKRGVVRDVFVGVDPDQDAHVEAVLRSLLAESFQP